METPIKFVGNFTSIKVNQTNIDGKFGLFLAHIGEENPAMALTPNFFWIDFGIFEDMASKQEFTRYEP